MRAIAKKYEMDIVSSIAESQFYLVKYSSSVQAYFLACRYGLEQHAREAAKQCLGQPFTEVLGANFQGLEGTESVLAFQRLLQYYLACRAAVRSLFKSWKWMLPIHWSLRTHEKTSQFWLFKSNHCCRKNSCVEMKDPIGNSYLLQMWWAKLVRGLQESLEEGPCDDGPLDSTEALQLFMKDGPDCVTCRSLAIESITAFESELSARMCKALDEVCGNFIFHTV